MEAYEDYNHEHLDDKELMKEVERFEQMLQEGEIGFMDLSTIEDLYFYFSLTEQPEKNFALLQSGILHFPYNDSLLYKLSMVHLKQGNTDLALEQVEKAIKIAPHNMLALVQKARILSQSGDLNAAILFLSDALTYQYADAEVYYHLGHLCQEGGFYKRAIEYYQKALAGNPEIQDIVFDLASCYEWAEEIVPGIQFLKNWVSVMPDSQPAWHCLGHLYQQIGFYENAIAAFQYAMALEEEFFISHYQIGVCYMAIEKYQDAISSFMAAIRLDSHDLFALFSLAECYESIEQFEHARSYYKRCTQIAPNMFEAWHGYAATLEAQEKYYEAITFYKTAVELNDQDAEAWLGLATCEYKVGNEFSAQEALQKAIQLNPEDPQLFEDWASMLLEDGEPAAALQLLRCGISENPLSPVLQYQFAAIAFQLGKAKEAREYLENALVLDYDARFVLFQYNPELKKLPFITDLITFYKP